MENFITILDHFTSSTAISLSMATQNLKMVQNQRAKQKHKGLSHSHVKKPGE